MIQPDSPPLDFEHVRAAAARIATLAHRTPVLTSSTLDGIASARLFFKCENFQRSGAFKFRGAANAVFSLDDATATRGVVTHSSGNHAAALALAAQLRGIPAHIVVPDGALQTKVAAVRRCGAHLVRCAPTLAAREETAACVLVETGGELIHPYNDRRIMAGQGTVALELLEEVPDLDALVVPVSGGGLISGCTVAAKHLRPAIRVLGAEPAGADDAARSIAAGHIVRQPHPETVCDGLRAFLGPLTFAVISARVDAIVTVDDAATLRAMRLIWEVLKIVVEPSSAIALAALLDGRLTATGIPTGTKVGIVLSGGNVDLDNLPWRMPA